MTEIIRLECPSCSTHLKIKGLKAVGKKIRCPKCDKGIVVPAPESEDAADEPAEDDDFLASLNSAVSDSSKRKPLPHPVRRAPESQTRGIQTEPRKLAKGRPRERESSGGMLSQLGFIGWIIGGAVGGIIGASIWAAVGVATGFEVGILAWGVGGLVGVGVRIVAEENTGQGSGIIAVLIAMASVLFGKFLICWFLVGQFADDEGDPEDAAISKIQVDVRQDFEKAGRIYDDEGDFDPDEVAPADKKNVKTYTDEDAYAEARKRWEKLDPQAKQAALEDAKRAEAEEERAGGFGARFAVAAIFFVFSLIHPLNLLWLGFAGFTAYKVGSGASASD